MATGGKHVARNSFWLSGFLIFFSVSVGNTQSQDILKTLHKEHPRLVALQDDILRVKKYLLSDPFAKKLYDQLEREAEETLAKPTVEYKIVGPRLLAQSRRCLERIYLFGLLYRLDGKPIYLDRAKKELFAAAAFPDWNPSHFLDTAEMTHAFAIGYDWFYEVLTPEEKTLLHTVIVEKGLKPALPFYEKNQWWTAVKHNWNQVCNGGIGIGALAVAEDEVDLASKILNYALPSIKIAMAEYAPDGGCKEGPGYWHYATRYTVYFLAALESALGTDFGLSEMAGFDQTGYFRMNFVGPLNLTFNYADAGSEAGDAHEMFWLANRFKNSYFFTHQRALLEGSDPSEATPWKSPRPTKSQIENADALDLLWCTLRDYPEKKNPMSLDAFYQGIDVVFFRSGFGPNDLFIGFKGGDNKANHSHLDLGSFVLDADGVRWALDLGADNYNLAGYFDTKEQRWTYYRLRNESHNTLVINNGIQSPRAAAPIVQFQNQTNCAYAVADLSAAYADSVQKFQRGMALIQRKQVLIQDEITAQEPVSVEWGWMTKATTHQPNPQTMILQQAGKSLQLEIITPEEARFDVLSANPPAPQAQNNDVKRLVIRFPEKQNQLRLLVLVTPYAADSQSTKQNIPILPLDQWNTLNSQVKSIK